MAATRGEQMVERLRAMQAAVPEIEAAALVSVDGLSGPTPNWGWSFWKPDAQRKTWPVGSRDPQQRPSGEVPTANLPLSMCP